MTEKPLSQRLREYVARPFHNRVDMDIINGVEALEAENAQLEENIETHKLIERGIKDGSVKSSSDSGACKKSSGVSGYIIYKYNLIYKQCFQRKFLPYSDQFPCYQEFWLSQLIYRISLNGSQLWGFQ